MSAGSSEKSIFTNAGMSAGMGNSTNMSKNAMADSMAVMTILRGLPVSLR